MKKIFLGLLAIYAVLVSCKSQLPPQETKETVTKVVKEVVHDTVFTIEKDKATYEALLKCQDEKVVIIQDTVLIGKANANEHVDRVLEPPEVRITGDNKLICDCETKAQELFARWKSEHTIITKDKITRIPYEVEKKLSWWQKTNIILGKAFITLLVVLIVYGVYSLKKPSTWIQFLKNFRK